MRYLFLLTLWISTYAAVFNTPFVNEGHTEALWGQQITRDGRTIVSVDRANEVMVWDTTSGKLRNAFSLGTLDPDPNHNVIDFALYPEHDSMVVIRNRIDVEIWDYLHGKKIKSFHMNIWNLYEITSTGNMYANINGAHCIVDLEKGKIVATIPLKNIGGHTISKDEKYLFIGHKTKAVKEHKDGKLRTIRYPTHYISMYDIPQRKIIKTFDLGNIVVECSHLELLAFHDKENKILSHCTGKIYTTAIDTGQSEIFIPDHRSIPKTQILEDGTVAFNTYQWTVFYDLSKKREPRTVSSYGSMKLFSPDGRFIYEIAGTLKRFDVFTDTLYYPDGYLLYYNNFFIKDDKLHILFNQSNLAVFAADDNLSEFRVFSDDESTQILSTAFPAESKLRESFTNPNLSVIDNGSIILQKEKIPNKEQKKNVTQIKVYDKTQQKVIHTISLGNYAKDLTIVDNKIIATVIVDSSQFPVNVSKVIVYDALSGQKLFESLAEKSDVLSAFIVPHTDELYVENGFGEITVWDIDKNKMIRSFAGVDMTFSELDHVMARSKLIPVGHPFKSFVNTNGAEFLSLSSDTPAKIRDLKTGATKYSCKLDPVDRIFFQNDFAAVFSSDKTSFWNVKKCEKIADLYMYRDKEWVLIRPDGKYKSSPGGEKYLTVIRK